MSLSSRPCFFCFRLSWLKVTEHLTERNMPVIQPGTKVSVSPVGCLTLSRDVTNEHSAQCV